MMIAWLDDAINDLQALHQYITKENPAAATKVAKRILKTVDLLSNQSGMGRKGRVLETRELIIPGTPFIIPYRVKNQRIEILRVFHCAMQWPEEL
jgi:toxin ParE1/3/4